MHIWMCACVVLCTNVFGVFFCCCCCFGVSDLVDLGYVYSFLGCFRICLFQKPLSSWATMYGRVCIITRIFCPRVLFCLILNLVFNSSCDGCDRLICIRVLSMKFIVLYSLDEIHLKLHWNSNDMSQSWTMTSHVWLSLYFCFHRR